jgi:hypothetical protein
MPMMDKSSSKVSQCNPVPSQINSTSANCSKVAFDIVDKTHVAIAKQMAPDDIKLQDELKEAFRIQGFENNLIKAYYPEKFAKGELPQIALVDGKLMDFGGDKAMFEFQFLDDVIKLPDTREIKRVISKYKDMTYPVTIDSFKFNTSEILSIEI